MPDRSYAVFYGSDSLIDPLGSVIINVNTTTNPQFEWVFVNEIKGKGNPNFRNGLQNFVAGYRDTVSWKIKFLENIRRHNNPSRTIGSIACLNSPSSPSCGGMGPFLINNKRYYIDFIVLYFANTTVLPSGGNVNDYIIANPIFSVDRNRCDEYYGMFIAVPKIDTSLSSYPVAKTVSSFGLDPDANKKGLFLYEPDYTNDLVFNTNITYRLTSLFDEDPDSYMDDIQLTPENIVLATKNTIEHGQTSIVSVSSNPSNASIVLYPQPTTFPTTFNQRSYLPFVLFRYVSEDAPTRQVFLSFSFSANV
jgi:hypothetical protein